MTEREQLAREASEYSVEMVEDRPASGMWHCGPNAAWVTVTHLPTMISARAFDQSHHKAKQAALACCEMMVEQSRLLKCQFPERLREPAEQIAESANCSPLDEEAREIVDTCIGHARQLRALYAEADGTSLHLCAADSLHRAATLIERLSTAQQEAVAGEREACAKVADAAGLHHVQNDSVTGVRIATAIRARGEG